LAEAAESIGLRTMPVKVSYFQGSELPGIVNLPLPCIVHWDQHHYVVVYKLNAKHVWIANPSQGKMKMTRSEFESHWYSDRRGNEDVGVVLVLEPSPEFLQKDEEPVTRSGLLSLWPYISRYRSLVLQLGLGLLVGSILQLIFPFLTQAIVDKGISNQDLPFVTLILLAQLVLFLSQATVQFIRSWILLHIGVRVNISLVSDFLVKLMRLPLRFFDTKMTGDLLQRIDDQRRIEVFLTAATLNTLFSAVNLVVFGIVLSIYSIKIFLVFAAGAALYVVWVYFFMQRRRQVDFRRFAAMSENQSKLLQLMQGIQDIKLHNSENDKRWEYERVRARLFRISLKSLAVEQTQEAGAMVINEVKNIFIAFIAARAVMNGEMTLGMMLSVQYIIGQLNAPLNQFIGFIRAAQDARMSLDRLGEIHAMTDEEPLDKPMVDILPEHRDFTLDKVSFRYNALNEYVLQDISLMIPEGKVTAIVGTSGSGKTTLIKMLLKFYDPESGSIHLGEMPLKHLSHYLWREKCGVVMQDGYLFSDTIARNIAVGVEDIDKQKLVMAAKMANIQSFIESLPLGYNTKIGQEGNGISQGQRQRILIARAVYKDPEFLFFDEATNALDANNEKVILENLSGFFKGRTVVVVAHRLSTVKNADQIVVLERGKLVEIGSHDELVARRGAYFTLVRNQLELGN
jgi:ATP-binding cassette subfamily B protein